MQPCDYRPKLPNELIGEPARLATRILQRISELKSEPDSRLKILLHGPPGNGKSTVGAMIAKTVANEYVDIEETIGGDLNVQTVRGWRENSCYNSMFGGWKVKLIHEIDLVTVDAENALLLYLDKLPEKQAVIGTSNGEITKLKERYRTRFQYVAVPQPSQDEITAWLVEKWNATTQVANWIGTVCCGNVRDALDIYSTYLMTGDLQGHIESKKRNGVRL